VASGLLPRNQERLRQFAAPGDVGASLDLRARSYLAVNCGHCHTQSGGGNSAMNFDWGTSAERMRAVNEPAQHGDFGMADARVIAPGAPGRSVLVPRMGVRGEGQMPPVASRVGDPEGLRLMVEWIQAMKP
jgi:mono/diheme cytochrome c family protein